MVFDNDSEEKINGDYNIPEICNDGDRFSYFILSCLDTLDLGFRCDIFEIRKSNI